MSNETPTISIDQEMEILSKARTTQHLTHAQARGIVKLFTYYFKERDSRGRIKRLSKQEKARRWKLYKIKVYQQYNRLIKSEFTSEAALVKRYSDPMSFLKYKLKRYRNLKVSDLTREDQDYYKEIGGLEDLEEMKRRQANIDSIPKGEQQAFPIQANSSSSNNMIVDQTDINVQQMLLDAAARNQRLENLSRNHNISNRNRNNHGNIMVESIPPPVNNRIINSMPPLSSQQTMEPKIDATLEEIHQNFNDFEREQLEKKRDTAQLLTQVKTKAFLNMVSEELSTKPQIIGMLPGLQLKHQLLCAFHGWISNNIDRILQIGYNKSNLCQKLSFLKGDNEDTLIFLQQWKLQRIIHKDDFRIVWEFTARSLNIRKPNDKEEDDFEQDAKTDEL